jgi:hypothetical protein
MTYITSIESFGDGYPFLITVVFGIGAFLSTLYFRNKAGKLQREIENLKHYGVISQKTFQDLFSKRIELYTEIIQEYEKYHSIINVSQSHWYDEYRTHDSYNVAFYELSKFLKEKIKPNQLLVTEELATKYSTLFGSQKHFLKDIFYYIQHGDPCLDEIMEMRRATEHHVWDVYTILLRDVKNLRLTLEGKRA